jgi:crotonobetainyl-CoA:carnitine CoA-transferase CaiB-like acyl-CoA transferase
MLQNVEQEEGSSVPITGPAVKFSRAPARIRAGAPALGAHTEEILREVGIKTAENRLPTRARNHLNARRPLPLSNSS